MGKIRVKTLGDESLEAEQKNETKKRKESKKNAKAPGAKGGERLVAVGPTEEELTQTIIPQEAEAGKEEKKPKAKKEKFKKETKRLRSKSYQTTAAGIDRKKIYPLKEALMLLSELKRAKFDETVELHINTTETGITASVTLPNGTGKKTRVAVADETLIAQVEKGKIDFDILLASPQIMPKLAKVARVLGPKGLMPNPKNGTVTSNPAEMIKKYEGGHMQLKTEAKFPIIHLSVGKLSFGEKKIEENIRTVLEAIPSAKVQNITLKLTMSPGVKIAVN